MKAIGSDSLWAKDSREGHVLLLSCWLALIRLDRRYVPLSRFTKAFWTLALPSFGGAESTDISSSAIKLGTSSSFYDIMGSLNENSSASVVS